MISVLIATYNRADMLERCLAQLTRQAFEPGDEIIVVDNGSRDRTAAVVREAAARMAAPVKYMREDTPGKSNALTAGLAIATGEIIALTDDDVLVADDWLTAIRRVWREYRPGLAGGRVAPLWEAAPPVWLRMTARSNGYGPLSAPLALVDYGEVPCPLGRRTALGANMAVSRRALTAAGGFPTTLGKLRGTLLSGEDHQICERVQQAGFPAIYDPRLAARHHVPADRLRLSYHLRWFFWSGITNAVIDRAARSTVAAPHWIRRAAAGAGRALVGAVTARPPAAVEGLAEVAFSLGYVAAAHGWVRPAPPAGADRARMEAA